MDLLWPGFLAAARRSLPVLVACLRLEPAPAAPVGRALLEPVAGPRGAARARRGSGATCRSRCSSSRWPAWSSRSARPVAIVSVPAGQTTIILAIDVSRQHVLDGHRAEPPRGRRGGRLVVHPAPGLDAPRSGSSRSPASPRSSRRRPPTRRSCSTSIAQPDDRAPDGDRQRDPRSRSTRSPRSTRAWRRSVDRRPRPAPARRRSRRARTRRTSSCC